MPPRIFCGKKAFRYKHDPKRLQESIEKLAYKNLSPDVLQTPQVYQNTNKNKLKEIELNQTDDMPTEESINFEAKASRCFICANKIQLDHKNARMLSQFTSPYTGRIYGRHITGLCIPMQEKISDLIHTSRLLGYMPEHMKLPEFLNDPVLTKHTLNSIKYAKSSE